MVWSPLKKFRSGVRSCAHNRVSVRCRWHDGNWKLCKIEESSTKVTKFNKVTILTIVADEYICSFQITMNDPIFMQVDKPLATPRIICKRVDQEMGFTSCRSNNSLALWISYNSPSISIPFSSNSVTSSERVKSTPKCASMLGWRSLFRHSISFFILNFCFTENETMNSLHATSTTSFPNEWYLPLYNRDVAPMPIAFVDNSTASGFTIGSSEPARNFSLVSPSPKFSPEDFGRMQYR